jgi:hypothetical protein
MELCLIDFRWFSYTRTYKSDAGLIEQAFKLLNATRLNNSNIDDDIAWGVVFDPLPVQFLKYGDLKGGNSLGLHASDGPLLRKY